MNTSVQFFDELFQRQVAGAEFALNPFELAALPYLRGKVLDYGCGLGNLVIEAARRGCTATALDASPAAIARIQAVARQDRLPIVAREADLRFHEIVGDYDTVVCIGLLMFFDCPTAYRKLDELKMHVRPGGFMVVNVLTEGTTYMDMFSPEGHCLFPRDELPSRFAGWDVIVHNHESFPAPGDTAKVFSTVIAQRPCAIGK